VLFIYGTNTSPASQASPFTKFSLCSLPSLECPIRLPFDPYLGAEMAGYASTGRKLAVVLATVMVPLLAVILYQAVDPTWYA
jgi:hypothetical protein